MGWDGQPTPAADQHADHTLIPAGDDMPGSQRGLEMLLAVPGRVELAAARPGDADVVHLDVDAGLSLGPGTLFDLLDDQFAGRLFIGDGDGWLGIGRHPQTVGAPLDRRPRADQLPSAAAAPLFSGCSPASVHASWRR